MDLVLRPAAGLAVLGATLGLLACGGPGDSRSGSTASAPAATPAGLAKKAFGPNRTARSGRIDGKVTIAVTGVPGYREPITTSISGPFSYRKDAALPDYAIDMSVRDRGVTLTSLRGRSFLVLGTTGYELPAAIRRRLARSSAKGRNGLTRTLEQFGVAPWRWEIDKRVGAVQTVNGVRSVRVDTGVQVGRVLRDANTLAGLLGALGLARANALPAEIPPDARRILVRSVAAAAGTSWIGLQDGVMRRAAMSIRFAIAPAGRARLHGISALTVSGQVDVTDVGRPQQIEAPGSLAPFSSLKVAFDALAEATG